MTQLSQIFSNRELAILIWIGVALVAMMLSKPIRNSFWVLLKSLFKKSFLIVYSFLIIYLLAAILLLKELQLWDIGDLKDTVMWLLTVGLVLIFQTTKAKDSNYFWTILKEAVKWTVILEFVVNFHSFSLLTEILVTPLIVFIVMIHVTSEAEAKNARVTKLLSNILTVIGLIYFCYAIYMTVVEHEKFFTFQTLNTFLLPIVFTALFIPFIYLLALYSAYELFFVRLNFMTTDKAKVNEAKKCIKRVANLNLDRLNRIIQNFEKRVFFEGVDLNLYIHTISKKNQ